MNEHDANRMLLDTARLRILEPAGDQLMTFSQRRRRAHEAIWLRRHWLEADRLAREGYEP